MAETIVRLENITKSFGDMHAVNDVSLDIKTGEFLTLLGPSGCGKTTTLRMIAGFEQPTTGNVWISDKKVNNVEPYNREVNTVFQNYSLFPHMNVFDNIAFGLKMKKIKKNEINERVMKVLKLVQLESHKTRKPEQLSGGQQQRIAIARAVVNNPQVLLLDEPLGALDLKLRKQMQLELKHLQQTLGITFIYVTHDQEEALTMSDRIVVMNNGKIEQADIPHKIYETPKTLFVANFIGDTNILEGVVTNSDNDDVKVQLGNETLLAKNDGSLQTGQEVQVSIRPENISFCTETNEGMKFEVTVKELIYIGSLTKVVTELADGQKLLIQSTNGSDIKENTKRYVTWNKEDCLVYQGENEQQAIVQ
ncbi:ABC transporter ATP-binding protein [Pseudogracilibacillus sp. SO30301A]|uniref:ABC transporter ATP-binding protein n=1 Tax=Pseudogracilibacillus sp. SO30301A TaxID=3098291 RepID=UPI00300E3949